MANTTEDNKTTLDRLYRQYLGRGVDDSGLQTYGADLSNGQQQSDVIGKLIGSDEYKQRNSQLAQAQYAPQLAQLDLNSQQATGNYDDMLSSLQKQAEQTPHSILNQFQHLGTRSSGLAGETLASGIQADQKRIGSAQQQRAIQVGQLALQRANLITGQQNYQNNLYDQGYKGLDQQKGFEQEQAIAAEKARREEEKYQQQLALQQQKLAVSRSNSGKISQVQKTMNAKQEFLKSAGSALQHDLQYGQSGPADPNNPSYNQLLQQYATMFPGDSAEFLSAFQPEQFLDPKTAGTLRGQVLNRAPQSNANQDLLDALANANWD